MGKLQFVAMRAEGILKVVLLSAAWASVIGLIIYLVNGGREPGLILAFGAAGGSIAFITNTGLGRWLANNVEGWGVLILIPIIVIHYVVVWPVTLLALRQGWVVRMDGT